MRYLVSLLAAFALIFAGTRALAKTAGQVGDPQRLEVPGQADAYYYRGLAYQAAGQKALAKADMDMAARLDPRRYKR